MKLLRIFILLLVVSAVPDAGKAERFGEIVVAGPSWDKFTNRDGTGLYHEILDLIFTDQGIPIRRIYVPSQRGNDLVRVGRADMMVCRDRAPAPLFLASYPMYQGKFHTFYNVKRLGEWKGPSSMIGHSVVFRLGYYSKKNFPASVEMKEVKTADAALGMVLLGRADFYIDDLSFIKETVASSHIPFDMADYSFEEAGWRQYFPVLLDSPRGRGIADFYARGIERLHRSGQLKAVFDKWGFPYPDYDIPQ